MGVRENIAHKPGFSIHAEWSYAVALDGLSPDPAAGSGSLASIA